MKKLLILLGLPSLSYAQEIPDDKFKLSHTVFVGFSYRLITYQDTACNLAVGYRLRSKAD